MTVLITLARFLLPFLPRIALYGGLTAAAGLGVAYIHHKGVVSERAKQERTEVRLQEQGSEARREAVRAVAHRKSGRGLLPVRKDPYQRD